MIYTRIHKVLSSYIASRKCYLKNLTEWRVEGKFFSPDGNQCITVRVLYLYTIVYYTCEIFPYFTVAVYTFSSCTIFMLHHFHDSHFCVVIFSSCTFLCCTISTLYLFHIALSPDCTISILICFFVLFFCNVFDLHSSPVPLLAYCTFSCCTFPVPRIIARTSPNICDGELCNSN